MHIRQKGLLFFVFGVIVVLFSFGGCSSDKPGGPAEGRQAAAPRAGTSINRDNATEINAAEFTLEPSEPTRNQLINLRMKNNATSPESVQWKVNGTVVEDKHSFTFRAADAKKGDTVQAVIQTGSGDIGSNQVTIANSPPEITNAFLRPAGASVIAEATTQDIDGDPVTLTYEWTKDGKVVGTTQTLNIPMKKGDKIAVKIVPFDGEAYGNTVIQKGELDNAPPVINQDKQANFDGRKWTYQIRASDPDGDPLSYSLKSGPAGMVVDASTGLITWNVPAEFRGKTSVTAVVKDGRGGESDWTVNIDISR